MRLELQLHRYIWSPETAGSRVPRSDAVVLLSGGLDPYTAAALSRPKSTRSRADHPLRRGPRGRSRPPSRRRGARRPAPPELDLHLRGVAASALTGASAVPKDRPIDESSRPPTCRPATRSSFAALAWAEILGASDLFIGVNALDYSGYPDCRPEYIAAFERMADLATKSAVEGRRAHPHAAASVESRDHPGGIVLGLDFGLTHSCYDPRRAAGPAAAATCVLRGRGFAEAGALDPAR